MIFRPASVLEARLRHISITRRFVPAKGRAPKGFPESFRFRRFTISATSPAGALRALSSSPYFRYFAQTAISSTSADKGKTPRLLFLSNACPTRFLWKSLDKGKIAISSYPSVSAIFSRMAEVFSALSSVSTESSSRKIRIRLAPILISQSFISGRRSGMAIHPLIGLQIFSRCASSTRRRFTNASYMISASDGLSAPIVREPENTMVKSVGEFSISRTPSVVRSIATTTAVARPRKRLSRLSPLPCTTMA